MIKLEKFAICFMVSFIVCINVVTADTEIKTIEFKKDENGYIQYFTNDKLLYGAGLIGDPQENTNPGGYEMEIIKNSGSEKVGCGMIFGAKDANNWYAIIIYPDGHFLVIKNTGGKLSQLIEGDSEQIIKGIGKTNITRAVKKKKTYEIYLNNNKRPFYTIRNVDIEGDKIGYFVMIGNSRYESFPEIPVDIRFKKKI